MRHLRERAPHLAVMAALGIWLGAGWAGSARADVIFSNFGPGDSFLNSGYIISGPDSSVGNSDFAMRFTVGGGDFTFTAAELALDLFISSGTNSLSILLMADAGGVPGTILETIQVSVPSSPSIVTATSAANPLLLAGQTYWLGTDATGDFDGAWFHNNQGQLGNGASNTGGPWFPSLGIDAAYRISGDPVSAAVIPEPSSLCLLGLGAAGLMGCAWQRRTWPGLHSGPVLGPL